MRQDTRAWSQGVDAGIKNGLVAKDAANLQALIFQAELVRREVQPHGGKQLAHVDGYLLGLRGSMEQRFGKPERA